MLLFSGNHAHKDISIICIFVFFLGRFPNYLGNIDRQPNKLLTGLATLAPDHPYTQTKLINSRRVPSWQAAKSGSVGVSLRTFFIPV